MSNPLEVKTVCVTNRAAWRDWLARNHAKEPAGIWLVYHKQHTGKPTLEYNESVEEALCFGWVDSLIRKIDDERFARKFTPRKSDSQWAQSNRERVDRLTGQGLMMPPGQALVDYAKQHGFWEDAPRPAISEVPPPAFVRALDQNPAARLFFDRLTDAQRREFVRWINQAKQEATTRKRVAESIRLLEQGKKLGMK